MMLYLSYGAGVLSTALMLLLEDMGFEFETVFVDTGCEHPETYEYLNYLRSLGYEITILKPNVQGFDNLYEYCKHYRAIPGNNIRWCTDKFKIRPLRKYIQTPAVLFIGIAYDEKHRAYNKPIKNGIVNSYPLIDYRITRKQCVEIIRKHGLKVPRKSGCWLCPFARKEEVRQLYLKHRELYEKRKELEKLATERSGSQRALRWCIPTEKLAMSDIMDIMSFLG